MKIFLLFLVTAGGLLAEPAVTSFTGTLTNTTAEVAAPARLEITTDGEKLTARIVTLPPLTGTGQLAGRDRDGWCELDGTLDGGFTVKFRGVRNARNFVGTYVAKPSHGETQYGRFEFVPVAERVVPTSRD